MGKNNVIRYAAFTGNETAEMAMDERISVSGDIIEENNVVMPDGSYPADDWLPAIFRPEAGLRNFDVVCDGNGVLEDPEAIEEYHLKGDTGHASYMILIGPLDDIEGLCHIICNYTGMTCAISEPDDGPYTGEIIHIEPEGTPHENFLDLLYPVPEW